MLPSFSENKNEETETPSPRAIHQQGNINSYKRILIEHLAKNIPLYFLFVFLSLFFLLCPQRYYINVIKSNFVSKFSYFFMIGI